VDDSAEGANLSQNIYWLRKRAVSIHNYCVETIMRGTVKSAARKYQTRAGARAWMTTLAAMIASAAMNFRDAASGQARNARRAAEAARELNPLLFVMLGKAEPAGITQQLLKLSRKELAGSEDMNLNEAIRETAGVFRGTGAGNIEYKLRLDPNLGVVRANRRLLEQVLINLLANAGDAMPGGGTVTIETEDADNMPRRADEDVVEPFVVLRVTDSGAGMSAEAKGRLFEPIFSGTRLGLVVVDRIIRDIGGTIQVESAPGKGTSFTIHIPWAGAATPGRSEFRAARRKQAQRVVPGAIAQ
jgi:signal transduction histidine kinase